jgi:hypothetical protein
MDETSRAGIGILRMLMVTIRPGGLRELHWHPNADEWQYYISGKGTNDRGGDRQPRANDGLSGGRRRLYRKKPAALRREYRDTLVFLSKRPVSYRLD